jgi:predicted kinase
VPFLGLWLDAPIEIMEARLSARGADASDADVDVLRQQQPRVTAPDDWKHIDASRPIEEVAEAALPSVADSIGMAATIHEPIH